MSGLMLELLVAGAAGLTVAAICAVEAWSS
jgi:hypothetical protein